MLLYLLPLEYCGYTKCCLFLSVWAPHRPGIKFLIENFTGLSIMNFIANYESEIVNQLGLQRNLSEN